MTFHGKIFSSLRILFFKLFLSTLTALVVAVAISGCDIKPTEIFPSGQADSIYISNIFPQEGTVLQPDTEVTIEARVIYMLESAEFGEIIFSIGSSETFTLNNPPAYLYSVGIFRGDGEKNFLGTITVSDSENEWVIVTVSLFTYEGTTSSDNVKYPILEYELPEGEEQEEKNRERINLN